MMAVTSFICVSPLCLASQPAGCGPKTELPLPAAHKGGVEARRLKRHARWLEPTKLLDIRPKSWQVTGISESQCTKVHQKTIVAYIFINSSMAT
jgi:hypothetical protein